MNHGPIFSPVKKASSAIFILVIVCVCATCWAYVPRVGGEGGKKPDFTTMTWPAASPSVSTGTGYDLEKLPAPPAKEAPPAQTSQTTSPQTTPKPAETPAQKPPEKQPSTQTITPSSTPSTSAPAGGGESKAEGKAKKNVQIDAKGYRYIRFRNFGSSGNQTRFESSMGLLTYGERIEQGTDMSITARGTKGLALTGSFFEMPHQDREMDFDLGVGLYDLKFGDIVATFEGGTFSPFSKKITGFQLGYETKKTFFQLISSQSKSQTHTETFAGRNIKGPYDLGANDLIPDNITVKLNNEIIGNDKYILDAFLGEITFYDILLPSDQVTVTYEQRLRGGTNAGNLMGFAGGYKTGPLELGYSYLTQQANSEAQKLQVTVNDETATLDLANSMITVAHGFIARTRDKGSETIKKVAGGVTTVLEPGTDYNFDLSVAKRMLNYRLGRFLLKNPDPAATYLVSYAYYPQDATILQEQVREALVPTAGVAVLSKQTVYYGSEQVAVCFDAALESIRTILTPGVDYDIDEARNQITLYRFQDEPYLRIDYWYYPLASVTSTTYDHIVQDFSLNYKMSKSIGLELETAISTSDVSNKSIQQLNETVAAVPAQLDCQNGNITASCTFALQHKNIVQNSALVYFNDRLSQNNILTEYSEFIMDTTQGKIEILVKIPAGTMVMTDYRYLPDRAPGLEQGKIWRVEGDFRNSKTQAMVSMKGADTFFTPVGGENNMQTSEFSWVLNHKVNPGLSLNARGIKIGTALDLDQTHNSTSSMITLGADWKTKSGLSLKTGYTGRTSTDDFNPRQTDSEDNSYDISGSAPLPFLKKAIIDFGIARQKLSNNAGSASDSETKRHDFGLNWKPAQNLAFTGTMTTSNLTTTSAAGSFTSRNNARSILMTYMPVKLLTIGAKIDRQGTSDSRPGSEPNVINQSMIRVDTKPFWKFNFLGVVRTIDDRPSVRTPSTHNETTNYTASLAITNAIAFTPTFNTTTSTYGGTSTNKNDNAIYDFEYRPPGAPYHFKFGTESGKRSSVTPGTSFQFKVKRRNMEFGFNPSPVWNFSTRLEKEKNDSVIKGGDSSTVDTLNMNLKYIPDKRRSNWITYNRNKLGGSQANTNSILELGLDYKLNELFSWDLTYRLSDYKDSDYPINNFKGTVLESSLRIEF